MRILGCVLALLVLGACSATSGDGPSGDTSDPGAQERLGREALKAASPGITAALAGSGWTLGTSANEVGVKAERDGVTLYIQRQRRTEDGVEWAVEITTPCVSYSEGDADMVSTEGGVDDLSSDF